ncbi:MAG: zf-HC2 domain-containing protein [Candidatus Korobacteraceae bacterium]
MSCTEWQGRIDAYVDAELPPSEMAAFRAHAEQCAACAASALAIMQGKQAIRRAGNRYTASADLRMRIASMAQGQDLAEGKAEPARVEHEGQWAGSERFTTGMWPRWALAAAAVLVIVAGLLVANRRQESKTLAEFADLHVAALASANPVEVISTDRHTVKPWFQGRIPFTFDLPELQGSPFELLGGRVAYFHQEPAAHLIFRYQRHLISVFIFRDASQVALPTSSITDQTSSFRLRSWTQGGLRYVVIGDAGAGTIQQLADLLRSTR